jgi:hypothetical protein
MDAFNFSQRRSISAAWSPPLAAFRMAGTTSTPDCLRRPVYSSTQILKKTDPSPPFLHRIKIVHMNNFYAIHLPASTSPRLAPLATRQSRLDFIPCRIREEAPSDTGSDPLGHHRNRRIFSPLRRHRLRIHPPRMLRLRP